MAKAIGDFAWYLEVERRRPATTVRAYMSDLDDMVAYLGERSPASITLQDMQGYLNHLNDRGLSASTVCRKLAALKSFFRLGIRNGWAESNPVSEVYAPNREDRLPKHLDTEGVEAMLEAPDNPRDKAILEVLYAAGLRVSELVGLGDDDVDLEQGTVKVRGKGGRERYACLHGKAVEALREWLSVRGECSSLFGLTDRTIRRIVQKYGKVNPHAIRHTYGTHLLDNGADIREVQVLMGHRSIQSTQIYAHVSTTRQREVYTRCHPRSN